MVHIRDMVFVNWVQRILKRKLTQEELEGESFRVVLPNGTVEYMEVPMILFPDELLTRPEDFYVSEMESLAKVS